MPKPLANLLLVLASLVGTALLFELVVFRVVLLAPDLPELDLAALDAPGRVLRYIPGQRGVYRLREEIASPWTVNAQGWNSARPAYASGPHPGVFRVAVVGDSYVEALQVPCDRSLAEDLERRLGPGCEVYRYGLSGAPASQYLQMIRGAVLDCRPDVLVVNLVHNDLDESWRVPPGVYTRGMLHLEVRDGVVTREVPPERIARPWYWGLRAHSATWRYLVVRRQVGLSGLRRLILGDGTRYAANIDVSELAGPEAANAILTADRAVLRYVFQELHRLADAGGFRVLVLMDGDRQAIESGRKSEDGPLRLNALAAQEAEAAGVPLLDLHPVFAADFAAHGLPFAFPHDGHWNEHAHQVAADALADWLRAQSLP